MSLLIGPSSRTSKSPSSRPAAGGASSRLVNAGDTTNWGVEVDAVAVLAEGLIADLSYGYLNTKFNTYLARNPATDPRSGHRRRDHRGRRSKAHGERRPVV